jgi:protein tyrosine phosphatase (PTP) superfamily phosphohydrolase (DUF442 family)
MTDAPVSEKAREAAFAAGFTLDLYRHQKEALVEHFARFEAELRREVVEQCAKVAEGTRCFSLWEAEREMRQRIATAIRAILDGEAG